MINFILNQRGTHRTIRTLVELSAIPPTPTFALDIETYGADKKPGGCAYYDKHGICGLALCNSRGLAVYIVVNDNKNYGGIEIKDLIAYLNKNWLCAGSTMVLHNAKFDLGFLLVRGLRIDLSQITIRDTWVLHSVRLRGVFTSNKLKDIMKNLFGLDVDTESKMKKWLEENDTEDYGDIPIEIMAPYGCDDVRYTLALHYYFLVPEAWEVGAHATYVRNTLYAISAESRGVRINKALMQSRMKKVRESLMAQLGVVRVALGASQVDIENEQEILAHLHLKQLHSAPREYFGETMYVLDEECLRAQTNALASSYLRYAKLKLFTQCFGVGPGEELRGALWQEEHSGDVGIHPNYLMGVFSKGGLGACKIPNFYDKLSLRDEIRELFIPRKEYTFTVLKPMDLYLQIVAWYAKDEELLKNAGKGGGTLCRILADRNQMSDDANSILFRRIVEGSGYGRLKDRLKASEIKVSTNRGEYDLAARFSASIHGFEQIQKALGRKLMDTGNLQDRMGRVIDVPQDKRWRAFAMLLHSSYGGICSLYMDMFCRTAEKTGARLVMMHNGEFVFEHPKTENDFAHAVTALLGRQITEPHPEWLLLTGQDKWEQPHVNAQELVSNRWY